MVSHSELASPDKMLVPEIDNQSDSGDEETTIKENINTLIDLLPNITEMETFLINGGPFHALCVRLGISIMPANLGSLTRVIITIPTDRIWFSTENDNSFSNKFKAIMEDRTEENWNWWPLQPTMKALQPGQTRLHWQCVSIPK